MDECEVAWMGVVMHPVEHLWNLIYFLEGGRGEERAEGSPSSLEKRRKRLEESPRYRAYGQRQIVLLQDESSQAETVEYRSSLCTTLSNVILVSPLHSLSYQC